MSTISAERSVRVWLGLVCLFLLGMIVLGGVTRLTQSGLTIVKWEPILGVRPPMSEADWVERFEAYKAATGQAAIMFPNMTVAQFKPLFYWEYAHRLVGRLAGLVFLLPYLYFLIRRKLSRGLAVRLAFAFVFGGLQGGVGWIMVASGLNPDSTHVSHIKLALHFGLALTLVSYVFWLWLKLIPTRQAWRGPKGLRHAAHALALLLAIQLIYGAFTAGLRAGYFYNTFPTMNGMWVPPDALRLEHGIGDLVNNPVTVQWIHRVLGWALAVVALGLWLYGRGFSLTRRQRGALRAVVVLVLLQFVLGVVTLLKVVPVAWGAAHQLNGALLLLSSIALMQALNARDQKNDPPSIAI